MRGVIWLGTATQMQRRHQAAANLAAWQGWISTAIMASIKPTHMKYSYVHFISSLQYGTGHKCY
jgi:hypothetical protein